MPSPRGMYVWQDVLYFIELFDVFFLQQQPNKNMTESQRIHHELKRQEEMCTCQKQFRINKIGEGKYSVRHTHYISYTSTFYISYANHLFRSKWRIVCIAVLINVTGTLFADLLTFLNICAVPAELRCPKDSEWFTGGHISSYPNLHLCQNLCQNIKTHLFCKT